MTYQKANEHLAPILAYFKATSPWLLSFLKKWKKLEQSGIVNFKNRVFK
jgi:hypothetical protein